jgi:hypothetical protein
MHQDSISGSIVEAMARTESERRWLIHREDANAKAARPKKKTLTIK